MAVTPEEAQEIYDRHKKGQNTHHRDGNPDNHPKNQEDDKE